MRLVTASAKNHSRIRPSDSASAITTARAERHAEVRRTRRQRRSPHNAVAFLRRAFLAE
jgi:hypothetical protein